MFPSPSKYRSHTLKVNDSKYIFMSVAVQICRFKSVCKNSQAPQRMAMPDSTCSRWELLLHSLGASETPHRRDSAWSQCGPQHGRRTGRCRRRRSPPVSCCPSGCSRCPDSACHCLKRKEAESDPADKEGWSFYLHYDSCEAKNESFLFKI